MRRLVIDTNYLQNPDLRSYLAHSPDNFALLNQITLIEVHKKNAHMSARMAMAILCEYPKQVVVLKDLVDFSYMPATTRPLSDLVDHDLSASFGDYCLTMIGKTEGTEVDRRFRLHESEASIFVSEQAATSANIYNLFRAVTPSFSDSEIDEMRQRKSYSEALQEKILHLAFDIRRLLLRTTDVPSTYFPSAPREIFDTYLFRYALVIALYFTRWIKAKGRGLESQNKLTNQILDMKIAAMATFFDGLLTRENNLQSLFDEAIVVISGCGGCVNCGDE